MPAGKIRNALTFSESALKTEGKVQYKIPRFYQLTAAEKAINDIAA
jgi:hypothetical protein